MFKKYKFKDYDFKLIFLVLCLSAIGVVAVGSAQPGLQNKQMLGVIAGVFVMVFVSLLNYNFVLKFYWLIYILNMVLLAAVALFGDDSHNAQRWLTIGGVKFQPSETAKILLILFFAQFIMKYREKLNTLRIISACILLIAIPMALIIKQPDLSTTIVLSVVFCIIMYSGGLSWKVILGALVVIIPAFLLTFSLLLNNDADILEEYQLNRVRAYLSPEDYPDLSYQQTNSVMAIGSGQLEGKGINNNKISSVKNGNFISEAQTDFIFAVIGEETGFRGCLIVIVLLVLVSLECLSIARRAQDLAGSIIASAVGSLIMFQGFFNIGVATFLLPNTGLTLPFVSNGLTSLMSLFIGIGFVLNVRLQAKKPSRDTIY